MQICRREIGKKKVNAICTTYTLRNCTLREAIGSRITLTSPDPAAISHNTKMDTIHSNTDQVTFTPAQGQGSQRKLKGTVESVPRTDEL